MNDDTSAQLQNRPFWIARLIEYARRMLQERARQRQLEKPPDRYSRRLSNATVYIALLTFVLAAIGVLQFCALVQADHTTRITNRAFVYVAKIDFHSEIDESNHIQWVLTPYWENSGVTRARLVDYESWCPAGAKVQVPFDYHKLANSGNGQSIGPKQSVLGVSCFLPAEIVQQVQRKESEWFWTARITYHDEFDPAYEHVTEWCVQVVRLVGDFSTASSNIGYSASATPPCREHYCTDDECKHRE